MISDHRRCKYCFKILLPVTLAEFSAVITLLAGSISVGPDSLSCMFWLLFFQYRLIICNGLLEVSSAVIKATPYDCASNVIVIGTLSL